MSARLDERIDTWHASACQFRVDYSTAVMERVGQEVNQAFLRFPRGGLEVGGVLFGVRTPDGIRILAAQQMACEHATGPSLVLSHRDETRLQELLDGVQDDPTLQGMEPLGWYHSHTRSAILLGDSDVQLMTATFQTLGSGTGLEATDRRPHAGRILLFENRTADCGRTLRIASSISEGPVSLRPEKTPHSPRSPHRKPSRVSPD